MEQNALRSLLEKCSAEIGITLEATHLTQFMLYLEHLRVWNQTTNLTSITADEEIIIKHFVDSLALLKAQTLTSGASLLDIGSGAGFPGLPLRIVRQDLEVTLIEPVQKKISFLHFIVGVLRLQRVRIFYGTLERFINEKMPGQSFDYVTTRALKYGLMLQTASQLLVSGGQAIIYSSMPIRRSELEGHWSLVEECEFDLPRGHGRRVISILAISQGQPA